MSPFVKALLVIEFGCLIAQVSFAISGEKNESNLFFALAMVFMAAILVLLGVEHSIKNINKNNPQ